MAVMALTTGTNTSFLDRLYEKQATVYTYMELAKQLDSREDIVTVTVYAKVTGSPCIYQKIGIVLCIWELMICKPCTWR